MNRKKQQVKMEQQEEGPKWLTHYSSDHQILLVGDGDFSFSLSLAKAFRSGLNIVASSLDSYDVVTKRYKFAKSNLDELQKLGACLLHEVDATKMQLHSDLKMRKFDRVIFNFPHAGFHGKEDNKLMIKKHKDLVLGCFKNASCMLRANGEVHVNHKTSAPFSNWNIEKLASQCFLTLSECAEFKKEDYTGYNNKRGDGTRCDKPFPLGKCGTFKFVYNPKAISKHKRRKQVVEELHGRATPPSSYYASSCMSRGSYISLQYLQPRSTSTYVRYSLTDHDEGYKVYCGCSNYLQEAVDRRTAQRVCYSYERRYIGARNEGYKFYGGRSSYLQEAHGSRTMDNLPSSLGARNESFNFYDRSSNYLQEAHGSRRTMDILPSSHVARNEGFNFYDGSSNYLEEAHGNREAHRGNYSFERYFDEVPGRSTLKGDCYFHSEFHKMSNFMSKRRRVFVGSY